MIGSATDIPTEAAIRQRATNGDVFIAYTYREITVAPQVPANAVYLAAAQCSGTNCATGDVVDVVAVGDPIYGHLAHPALGIRQVGTGPIELMLTRVEKIEPDCDADGVFAPDDGRDMENADLEAYAFTSDGNGDVLTADGSWDVSVNGSGPGQCMDRGMTSTRYALGEAWACYTKSPASGNDLVQCNSSVGATATAWVDTRSLTESTIGGQDHPGLDFIGDKRIVPTSLRDAPNLSNDAIWTHFPDTSATNYPIIQSWGNWSNHPIVDAQTNLVQMVWHREQGAAAQLWYAQCHDPQTSGCDLGTDWTSAVVANGADEKYPHLDTDGNFQIIAFTKISVATGKPRVYVTSRCGTDGWSAPEIVRTNTNSQEWQSMAFGRPGLVLNKQDNIAHIVLLDDLDQDSTEDPTVSTGNLYWYRKPYTECAP